MEEEIEDLVGDVRYSDSQKSVTTANAYSPDFTDSSSDKNHSSGKDTYIIDCDDSDDSDDSDKTFQIHDPSTINLRNQIECLNENPSTYHTPVNTVNRSACTSFHKCSIVSQEIYTQTSKTIFELVANETDLRASRDITTLQTQTSFLSVTENRTVHYKTEAKNVNECTNRHEYIKDNSDNNKHTSSNMISIISPNTSQEDSSTKYPESETQNDGTEDGDSESTFSDRVIPFIDAESDESMLAKNQDKYENGSNLQSSKFDSDIEEDSLILNECSQIKTNKQDSISDTSIPKSIDNDVEELYSKISESIDLFVPEKLDTNLRRFGTLTPLTEETVPKKDSIIDVTPCIKTDVKPNEKNSMGCVNNSNLKHSLSHDKDIDKSNFKLPPIKKNKSCPNSPNLNFLFSINTQSQGNRQSFAGEKEKWDFCTKNLGGGESPSSGRSDPVQITNRVEVFHLPPIHVEGIIQNENNKVHYFSTSRLHASSKDTSNYDSINIKDKIKELKVTDRKTRSQYQPASRTGSPSSTSSPEESRLCDVAERGSEALCVELLRRLRSPSWSEAADTLRVLPQSLDKFWTVLSENRTADLIRQVTIHVDSPRTQLARLACSTLAQILKSTKYTKKPDFYEAVTTLLMKTGSLSRPVRRAANVALDEIVSSAELSHVVTALCVHGVGHKSALVRSAVARLLVVCCALREGGRLLLRARPPSAAAARRHALRSLAVLLDDKNMETRKYAERLYIMLRPLHNFEAYFLTDVDVELASRQMKRFDEILIRNPKTR